MFPHTLPLRDMRVKKALQLPHVYQYLPARVVLTLILKVELARELLKDVGYREGFKMKLF